MREQEGPNKRQILYTCKLGNEYGCNFVFLETNDNTSKDQKMPNSKSNMSGILSEIQLNNIGIKNKEGSLEIPDDCEEQMWCTCGFP